jgi:hypothetical protein
MDKNFAWIFVAIGLWFLVKFALNMGKANRAMNWPTVEGRVTESLVSTHRSRRSDSGARTNLYGALVRYSYMVKGVEYSGERVTFADTHNSDRSKAEAILARYAIGAAVRVYYNPEDPQNALLEPGISNQSFLPLLIPLAFLVVGIVVFLSPAE